MFTCQRFLPRLLFCLRFRRHTFLSHNIDISAPTVAVFMTTHYTRRRHVSSINWFPRDAHGLCDISYKSVIQDLYRAQKLSRRRARLTDDATCSVDTDVTSHSQTTNGIWKSSVTCSFMQILPSCVYVKTLLSISKAAVKKNKKFSRVKHIYQMTKTTRRIDVYNLIIVQLVLSQQTSAALVKWLVKWL